MKETYDRLRATVLENLGIDHTATSDLLKLYFSKNTADSKPPFSAENRAPDSLAAFFSKYHQRCGETVYGGKWQVFLCTAECFRGF